MDVNSLSEINGGDRLSAIPKPGPIPQPELKKNYECAWAAAVA